MNKFIKNISISKKLAIISSVFSFAILFLLMAGYFGFIFISLLQTASGVNNSLAKLQKDAVIYLNKYAYTRSDQDYEKFISTINVTQFYKIARLEILKPKTDFRITDSALTIAGMNSEDVRFTAYLLKYTQSIGFVEIVLDEWKNIELANEEIFLLGSKMHQEVLINAPADKITDTLNQIVAVNNRLTMLEVNFTQTLEAALHWAVGLFQGIMIILTLLFLSAGIYIAYQISNYLYTEIEYLRIGAGKIAVGDFTSLGSIYAINSTDEVGQLTSSFIAMADKLNEFYATLEEKVQARTEELKKANLNIEEKNKSLEEALKVKSEFLRIANHQLNTPLSIMNNAYSMVKDKSLTLKEGMEYWGAALRRMNHVVEYFWSAFRLDGEFTPVIVKSDISAAVKEVVEDNKKILFITGNKKIDIVIEKPNFSVPQVMCDIKKINNVIYNLLENAILYTSQGLITVSYELIADNAYLKVNIKDTGIGFSKEDKEKMAQKFYRAKKAVLTHPDGSGLGLFICRIIIESNGGKLRYESEGEGKGSTFSFTLPVAE